MADFLNNSNVAVAARTTANRDVVTSLPLGKWLIEGKLFEAGFAPEDTAADSQAAIDDTLVTFALQAVGASKIVIPLFLRLACVSEGGAAQRIDIAFTKPANLCATNLTLTGGRAMTSIHNMYRTSPAQSPPTALALYGAATTFAITASALVSADYVDYQRREIIDNAITASALVAADYVDYQRREIIDNAITAGLPMLGGGTSNVLDISFLREGAPRGLTAGAAMLVYINVGTTDATYYPYVQWAEVEPGDLI